MIACANKLIWFILAHMSTPALIGRYKIKSELGRGGMATVYLAFDPNFNRDVAVKVLPREMLHDPQFRARFEREIKTAAGLEHPSIVPVYDVGEDNGQPYFVMRLMTGGSLADMIERGRISLEDTARIISKIAQGLTYAHRKGVIHRDLKPDNILFDDNGAPFISDFGVARLSESTGSLTGSGIIGTPAYMSPEQAQGGNIDQRSDIYGLGVIVYQMLSGRQPYSADTPMGVVVKHITEPVPEILEQVPDLPGGVDEVVRSSMAKDRNKRYSTAVDLAKALNMIAFGNEGEFSTSNTGIHTRIYKAPGQSSSRGVLTGVGVALIVILVLAVGIFLLRNQLFAAPEVQSTAAPALTAAPTDASVKPAMPTLASTPTPAPATATAVPFAPACAASVTLPTPVVKEIDKLCVDKNPYTTVSIPEGATFESLDPKMTCRLERTKNGKSTLSCAGEQLISYKLKVCLASAAPVADAGKCAQGSTFDTTNQCCVTTPPDGAGCTLFKVDLRACK
jgi:hypothetical protein